MLENECLINLGECLNNENKRGEALRVFGRVEQNLSKLENENPESDAILMLQEFFESASIADNVAELVNAEYTEADYQETMDQIAVARAANQNEQEKELLLTALRQLDSLTMRELKTEQDALTCRVNILMQLGDLERKSAAPREARGYYREVSNLLYNNDSEEFDLLAVDVEIRLARTFDDQNRTARALRALTVAFEILDAIGIADSAAAQQNDESHPLTEFDQIQAVALALRSRLQTDETAADADRQTAKKLLEKFPEDSKWRPMIEKDLVR